VSRIFKFSQALFIQGHKSRRARPAPWGLKRLIFRCRNNALQVSATHRFGFVGAATLRRIPTNDPPIGIVRPYIARNSQHARQKPSRHGFVIANSKDCERRLTGTLIASGGYCDRKVRSVLEGFDSARLLPLRPTGRTRHAGLLIAETQAAPEYRGHLKRATPATINKRTWIYFLHGPLRFGFSLHDRGFQGCFTNLDKKSYAISQIVPLSAAAVMLRITSIERNAAKCIGRSAAYIFAHLHWQWLPSSNCLRAITPIRIGSRDWRSQL